MGIMAYGPLSHGLLTGAFTAQTVFEPTDWRSHGDVFGQPLFAPGRFSCNPSKSALVANLYRLPLIWPGLLRLSPRRAHRTRRGDSRRLVPDRYAMLYIDRGTARMRSTPDRRDAP